MGVDTNDTNAELMMAAKEVLAKNYRAGHTIPASGLYPHQWLWDSCFVAIGLRHYSIDKAQAELLNLLKGQWSNGMLPHMILDPSFKYRQDREILRSYTSPYSPDHVFTSGITQPPMLAEGVVKVGEKLSKDDRRIWYGRMYPAILAYHTWQYVERDPKDTGLVLQLHPWETGLDNSPPWVIELHKHRLAWWIKALTTLKLDTLAYILRRDTKFTPPGQRLSTTDALIFYSLQRHLRIKSYDINKVLARKPFAIEDITYNSIFIRANTHLRHIAKIIGATIPAPLLAVMKQSEDALEQLWDQHYQYYYSRNFVTGELIKSPTIGSLMPLYSGVITKERAKQLVDNINNPQQFFTKYIVPSVPKSSEWFDAHGYWQGPAWVNTNWLIADGLRRYGYKEEADRIAKSSLELVEKSGFHEYFSPLDGTPAGADNFSWTAALTIDFLSQK